MKNHYSELSIATHRSFEIIDITGRVRALVSESGIREGMVVLSSLHTTCALCVNEDEKLLAMDMQRFFLGMAAPEADYEHNKLHLRPDIPPDEPENAHAHLISMLLGNSESLAVHAGLPVMGRYQSILLVEVDGPRQRKVAIQIFGE